MSSNTVEKHNDLSVKIMLYPALIFFIIGMFIGVFMSFNSFLFPDYFAGEYIHFGRIRPVHVWHVLFLWLLSANIGLFFFFIPRLCGRAIWSDKIAYFSCAIWWFALILVSYSYPMGTNSGWEYAELPTWIGYIPVKAMLIIAWLLFTFNFFATIATRRFEKMYVSLWYSMGALVWASFTLILGFFAVEWLPAGLSRVNANFFYIHNLVGLIFTPMGLATAYYFLPKISNLPIYSHRLSMIGFWTVAFVYGWVGTHHLIHGPTSQWLQTTSIIFSIWLFIPVWTVVHNLFATLKNNWHIYVESVPIRFLMLGNAYYLITCIQGPLMALRNVNEVTSKTDWVIGHSHVSLYGTFTFFAIAGIYYVIPVITKKPLWSKRLAEWHFNANLIGSIPFILSLWIGGFLQGVMWSSWGEGSTYAEMHNNFTLLPFLQTVADMRLWWWGRSIGGILVLFGNIFFAVNIFNTIILNPLPEEKKKALVKVPA